MVNFIIIGQFIVFELFGTTRTKLPEISLPYSSTTVELDKKFIELFIAELDHSQMISDPTYKNGKILVLLFTNVPDLLDNLTVLGRTEFCSSDHFGILFSIKLDVSLKKNFKT